MTSMDAERPERGPRPGPCPAWRDRLLEADPVVLAGGHGGDDGGGTEDLALHLRVCGRCARAADRLLAATAELDRMLDGGGGPVDAGAIVRRGRARRAASVRDRARWTGGALLAAAAVAALLLVPRAPRPQVPAEGAGGFAGRAAAPGLDLVASRDVAVLSGADADITILWFFDAQGGAP